MTTKQRLEGGVPFPDLLSQYALGLSDELRSRPRDSFRRIPLGFPQIDYALGGGIMGGVLGILIGRQNVGKTAFFLQIARNIARWAKEEGAAVVAVNVCYEHNKWTQFLRLLALESRGAISPARMEEHVYRALGSGQAEREALWSYLLETLPEDIRPAVEEAYQRLVSYGDHLALMHASRFYTTIVSIEEMIKGFLSRGKYPVMLVDYLQIIPPPPEMQHLAVVGGRGGEKAINRVVLRGLSDMASRYNVPIFCVAAVDDEALRRPGPVHMEDVEGEGSDAIPYTVEYALVLNPEVAVLRDGELDQEDHLHVRIGVEKVRGGYRPPGIEWRFLFTRSQMRFEDEGEEIPEAERFALRRYRASGGRV